MTTLEDFAWITPWIVETSLVVFFALMALIFFGPTQYDPYVTDQKEQNEEEKARMTRIYATADDFEQPMAGTSRKYNSSVTIVVLGDIGRSPRMQYHAISFATEDAAVQIVGYLDSDLHPDLRRNANVKIVALTPPPRFLQTSNKLLFPVLGAIKVLWQTTSLLWTLYRRTKPTRWMLVQNPPAIPTLGIAKFICFARNMTLVVDWHNFGWSVLALKLGQGHYVVTLSKLYETLMARMADKHITVSNAMADWINKNIGVEALAFHDRPTSDFQPIAAENREAKLLSLQPIESSARDITNGKTRLLVSSTSWTADEDFGMLLDACVAYSNEAKSNATLPRLLLVITGKGPQRKHYLECIKDLENKNKLLKVKIVTAWLSFADYASLLGAADLGISLHKSTSGVDLPMKVVDMFGAGLPVIGWSDYESWPELVTEGVDGRGFRSTSDLEALLIELCSKSDALRTLKQGALKASRRRWRDEWLSVAANQLFYPERKSRK